VAGARLTGSSKRSTLAAVSVLVAGAAVLLFVPAIPSLCPIRWVVGQPCPSCGLTRATRLAIDGDWMGAFHMHPLWPVALAFVAFAVAVELMQARGGRPALLRWRARFGIVLVIALLTVWVARFFGLFGGPAPV
jgi:hypothetical protein